MAAREVLEPAGPNAEDDLEQRLAALRQPAVERSLADLQKRYAKHAASARAVRNELDRVMDGRLLTEELDRVRGA